MYSMPTIKLKQYRLGDLERSYILCATYIFIYIYIFLCIYIYMYAYIYKHIDRAHAFHQTETIPAGGFGEGCIYIYIYI